MRAVILALLALAAAASNATAQDKDTVGRYLRSWEGCVTRSFDVQRRSMPDPSLAVEMSFVACQTEEDAIFASGPEAPRMRPQYGPFFRSVVKKRLTGQ